MSELIEQHFTVQELAKQWRVSADTIRRAFRDENGVLHLGRPKHTRRIYDSIRIPQTVAERVYRRLTTGRLRNTTLTLRTPKHQLTNSF